MTQRIRRRLKSILPVRHHLYTDQIDEILATIDSNGLQQAYLGDHQGTLFDLVDEFAGVVNHLDYDSFGLVRSQSDPLEAVDHLFTGRSLMQE